jgi:hypothetical protein
LMAVIAADWYLCLAKVSCVSPEEALAELNNAVQSHAAVSPMGDWFPILRAFLETRMDPDAMGALRRCALVPNVMAAETARIALCKLLLRLNRIDELEAELSAHSPIFPNGRAYAAICSAFVALWRGEPERALRELAAAEELARVASGFWAWELLHAGRAGAFVALGRKQDAVASVRTGLARMAYTLEGIDDNLRAGVEIHVDEVKRLRALAKELGVTDAIESAPS